MSKDTLNYYGETLEIEYDYSPPEPMVRYYADGSGHPGYPSEFEITSITCNGVDVFDEFEEHLEDIEEVIRISWGD